MDCKSALTEANGDFEKAIEILRLKGQKLSLKRADRDAKEGVVYAMVSADGKKGVVIRLSSETDFVAKNEDFVNLAKEFTQIALDTFPADLETLLKQPYQNITIGEKVSAVSYTHLSLPRPRNGMTNGSTNSSGANFS